MTLVTWSLVLFTDQVSPDSGIKEQHEKEINHINVNIIILVNLDLRLDLKHDSLPLKQNINLTYVELSGCWKWLKVFSVIFQTSDTWSCFLDSSSRLLDRR